MRAKAVRPDAIIATGRSDFPNQVNNVLGFPFIFRGALDVQATTINEEMKIAAATAIAELARERVPEEVASAYGGQNQKFGTDYIIPAPFDPRLMEVVSSAVAKAAMDSGVAEAAIEDFDAYQHALKSRLNPTTSVLTGTYNEAKANPKRMVFAEAEEEVVLRAAIQYRDFGYGTPILVGRTKAVMDKLHQLSVSDPQSFEIQNSNDSDHVPAMVDYLYARLQRKGYTERDVRRMVNQERNVFAALLVALGHGDGMISGLTRTFSQTAREINLVLDPKPDALPFAFLSYSTFGNPSGKWLDSIREAVAILDAEDPGFEYEGEMAPDAALNEKVMELYPFSRLSGPANVLIMPGLQSANLSAKLLRELGGDAR